MVTRKGARAACQQPGSSRVQKQDLSELTLDGQIVSRSGSDHSLLSDGHADIKITCMGAESPSTKPNAELIRARPTQPEKQQSQKQAGPASPAAPAICDSASAALSDQLARRLAQDPEPSGASGGRYAFRGRPAGVKQLAGRQRQPQPTAAAKMTDLQQISSTLFMITQGRPLTRSCVTSSAGRSD